jgi:lipid-A-disaccharide synthase
MKIFKIFVITGEASGDRLAANLLEKLSIELPINIYGTGGSFLKNIGQKQYYSIENLEIIGIDGLMKNSINIFRIYKDLLNKLEDINPDILLLVDYPGFNLRFANAAKRKGFKIIYYVAPQVWAWHYSRIYKLKKYVDLLLCILPFEAEMFTKVGINAVYTGNPAISRINYTFSTKSDFFNNISLSLTKTTITILPGSRTREIERHMTVIGKAMKLLKNYQFIVCSYNKSFHKLIEKHAIADKHIKIVEGLTYDSIKYADFAWVSSGTATLETAIINTPMLIFYKTSFLTYLLAKLLVRIPYIGLPNIIAGEKIVPELIGNEMTSLNIIHTFNSIKENSRSQIKHLEAIKEKLLVQNIDPITYAENILKKFLYSCSI